MSVPQENMKTLMQWLSDSQDAEARAVTEDLARLVFLGDEEWPNYDDRASSYADAISAWLDGDTESRFIALTAESGNLAAFTDWMVPVIEQWDASAAQDEAGQEGRGLENPNYGSDPTPGTQYYKYDEADGTYLYSATADGADGWKTYEERRYSDPTWDDNYGLSYRHDKRDEVYEWYDEQNGTWNDQSWADMYAASRSAEAAAAGGAGAEPQAPSAAEWDENWQMFYRIGPNGTYEYADAVVPRVESSGSSEVWLTYDQVAARDAEGQGAQEPAVQQPAAQEPAAQGAGEEAAVLSQQEINAIADELLAENDEFKDIPEDRRREIIAEVLRELQAQ